MRYFTFKKQALAHRLPGDVVRFTKGKGYWLLHRVLRVQITMYDSVNPDVIPAGAKAVAGYVGGRWPTFPTVTRLFPNAHHLSIAVSAVEDADCLDIEQGDASIAEAPGWVKRQQARGVKRPVVYTSLSQAQLLLRVLARAGVPRSHVRVWTAHYTLRPHRCTSRCGYSFTGKADATQYHDRALGRNLDASVCSGGFF